MVKAVEYCTCQEYRPNMAIRRKIVRVSIFRSGFIQEPVYNKLKKQDGEVRETDHLLRSVGPSFEILKKREEM